ncbi:MAG: helix-turn-helix transcriptional regulator [Gordonia sp. (in: high G+C Gram-positive bacteria)]|uniref:helix-turn-helix domain-containing protein n=1 Tax=Gordonia sp. (in: high G+C Gram-positive bacteria) TaxID=84139 RepID=UPI003BB74190
MTDDEISAHVGHAIANRRKELGMTVQGLAEKAEMNRPHLVKIESGKGNPTILTISHLSRVLDTNPSQLLQGIA